MSACFALGLMATPVDGTDGTKPSEEDIICANTEFINQLTAQQLHAYYTRRHCTDGFNGCVLVAKDGKPVYSGAFGYANIVQKDTLSTQSSFQLASVTKTFTSSAILKLVEGGKLSLDDSIQQFFPEFPYHGITVKLLLSHRSGLPDYIYWDQSFIGPGVQYLTNQSMLDLFVAKHPPLKARPDKLFNYSNTNYALLALIVEKASGVPYKQYMQDNIFGPLGMTHTFICTAQDTASIHCGATCYEARRWKEWKWVFSDGVVGDKGIYSSVEDMLKWDNALKEGKVLSAEMLTEAYKPHNIDRYSFAKDRRRNYGYGWRTLKQPDGSSLIYHNGNWHGCNNVFCRNLSQGYTVIVLGNKENGANYQTQPIWDIIARVKSDENVAASSTEGEQ
jgi:CubicO group peptidase (beta-lactamase class C family)